MSRLSEAIYMANCSPKEWTKYSKTTNDLPTYLFSVSLAEAKRLRKLNKVKSLAR